MEWLRTVLIGLLLAAVVALVAARVLKLIGAAVLAMATLGLLVGAPMDAVLAGGLIGTTVYTAGVLLRALQRRPGRAQSRPPAQARPNHTQRGDQA